VGNFSLTQRWHRRAYSDGRLWVAVSHVAHSLRLIITRQP